MEKSFRQVEEAAAKGANVIPLVREFVADVLTPVAAYQRFVQKGEHAFLLESVEGGERIGRYSFLGARPFATLTVRDSKLFVTDDKGEKTERKGCPFQALGKELEQYRSLDEPGLPRLCCGAVGYLGYEMVRHLEPKVQFEVPDGIEAQLMLFNRVIAFDRLHQRLLLISSVINRSKSGLRKAYKDAKEGLDEMEGLLRHEVSQDKTLLLHRLDEKKGKPLPMRPLIGNSGFSAGVRRLKNHIRAGDIFQAVLSDRFEVPFRAQPFTVYRALRTINPSPYMFYLDLGEDVALGASPEMLVRVEDGVVETRPIAGTRPRGMDEKDDIKQERNLLASVKERAEHIMLVDLGRNDVGRVAKPGTVSVASLMHIERYSHVMHMVSSVVGRLKKGKTPWQALGACFPAGTLTGAPKIKAMELVGSIEPEARGVYGGAIVSYDFRGTLDSAIAIRSMVVKGAREDGRKAFVQAGAGIVYDSKPNREWEEVRNKASAVLEAIRIAEQAG